MPTLLLTGARGMLGRAVSSIFSKEGYRVVATDRSVLDITDCEAVRSIVLQERPDVIVNTAAYNFVDNVENPAHYDLAYAVNALGPENLAIVAKEKGIPFVHYSTDYVFDGKKIAGYTEADERSPISKYGFTKAEGERLVEGVGGMSYICRLSKLFGEPGVGDGVKMSFVALMLKLAKEKPEIGIVDEEVGCPTYAEDIAVATVRLLREHFAPGIYHFVNSGSPVTWFQFAEEIFSIASVTTPRKPIPASAFPRVASLPKFAALLNTKFPPLPLREDALRRFLVKGPSAAAPQVSIIIVSLNIQTILRENLQKLFSLREKCSFEVLVVDNGSEDGTARMVRDEFPQVHLIQNDYNSGFSHACNQGLRMAKGEVLVLCNPDMVVGDGALSRVYEQLRERQDVGVMSVKLVSRDGTVVRSVRRDPLFKDQFAILLKLPWAFPSILDRYLAKDFDYNLSQGVDQVRGSFFAFRRDVMEKIGMLDERYFVWFEEVDFCIRAREAGYKIWYDANVQCVDLVGQTFKTIPTRLKQYHFSNSMRKYFAKWHPGWQAVAMTAILPFTVIGGACYDTYRFLLDGSHKGG